MVGFTQATAQLCILSGQSQIFFSLQSPVLRLSPSNTGLNSQYLNRLASFSITLSLWICCELTHLQIFRKFCANLGHHLRQKAPEGGDGDRLRLDHHRVRADGAPPFSAVKEIHSPYGGCSPVSRQVYFQERNHTSYFGQYNDRLVLCCMLK